MKKHKVVLLLISLVAAVLFWIYVVTSIAPDTTGSVGGIKVSVIGDTTLEARGLMITGYGTSSVRVDLETTRATLSKLNAGNVMASLDVSRITEPGEYDLSYTITFPDTVNSGNIRILRKSVDTIHIKVDSVITRTLPIEMQWTGQVQDDCLFDENEVTFSPESVVLKGPDYEVNAIASAVIYYDISELDDTTVLEQPLIFLDELGNEMQLSSLTTASVSEITTTLPILRLKDIKLAVDLKYGAGIGENNVNVTLSPDTIRVSGMAEVIEALKDELTVGEIDLTKVSDGETKEFPLTFPSGVNSTTGETTVIATVKFDGLLEQTFTVSNIDLINVPDNLTVEQAAKAATVKLRGSADVIRGIDADDIHVIVDLSKETQGGDRNIEATVSIDGNPDVGLVGKLSIYVSLIEK